MRFFLLFLALTQALFSDLYLRDNLQRTKAGDFIVAAQGKTISLLRIVRNEKGKLSLEEISAPLNVCSNPNFPHSWRSWAENGAPGNTSWVIYQIDLTTGKMESAYSYTRRTAFQIPQAENFLGNLLTLRLSVIPVSERKMVGPPPRDGPDFRKMWQPKMVVDGCEISGVRFSGWKTRWPKDGSELSERFIYLYLPDDPRFASYFPHWLEIAGFVGKAKVRIIDSGENLFLQKRD